MEKTKEQRIIEHAKENNVPTFTFIPKDELSINVLNFYYNICVTNNCSDEHLKGIQDKIEEFKTWQENNEVKLPGNKD